MIYYVIQTGQIKENAYFLVKDNKETLIVDPGDESNKLITFIEEKNLKPVAILLTHAHWDHIQAVDVLRQKYNILVYLHELEKNFLSNPLLNLSSRHENVVIINQPDITFKKMGYVSISGFRCRIEHVPGHSPGSIVYLFEKDKIAVVGDTLFKGGCGRTDLPGSSTHAELMEGIKQHLMTLPEDTIILSGHGEATTIAFERKTNPYLNGVTR